MRQRSLPLAPDGWEPWSPVEVAARLQDVSAPWYVLAGWALDLFLGRQTREHDDIEIGVPHDRFPAIQVALRNLELAVVGDGEAWPVTDDTLAKHRQTWVREPGGPWRLDVIRERWDGDHWVFRRDGRIRLPGTNVIARTSDGIPFLRPEIVLLFKAKAPRPKDWVDLEIALPELDRQARAWLTDALTIVHPGHPWLEALDSR